MPVRKLTRWLAAEATRNCERVNDLKVRARYGALEGWTSLVVNALLFAVRADEQGTHDIIRSVREEFAESYPEMRTIVRARRRYAYSPVVGEEEAGTP